MRLPALGRGAYHATGRAPSTPLLGDGRPGVPKLRKIQGFRDDYPVTAAELVSRAPHGGPPAPPLAQGQSGRRPRLQRR
jgi:hypothetical protein